MRLQPVAPQGGDPMSRKRVAVTVAIGLTSYQFSWCFSGIWEDYQPTVKEAVARIRHLVSTGQTGILPWEEY
jgi:hypothetical protein